MHMKKIGCPFSAPIVAVSITISENLRYPKKWFMTKEIR